MAPEVTESHHLRRELQPEPPDDQCPHSYRQARAKILTEPDFQVGLCGLYHNDVGNAPSDGEIARQGRGHSEKQPRSMGVRRAWHQGFEQHDGRNIADQIA